ncbi:hypothetical protein [Stakelama tenebrarum]|uniref:Uncharacterized protein n=1 Tax=Stakelama tenebrarum TaxID=2711215 RepID=A0A6G6Y2X0_9SPHN|nr:hypothetical protein [Sphingosinithalassobacter tenebrarum]QIG78916.1 hypothetical protein G5C33_03350 [Sphingosinithalassobacter tenebrarum]
MSIRAGMLLCAATLVAVPHGAAAQIRNSASPPAAQRQPLRLDPAIFAAIAQLWEVIGRSDNPVWPGWDASDTPVLVYFPGEQEILLNHPAPPEGYVRADGLLPIVRPPGERVWVRNGETHFPYDGQNTRTDIGGVSTLVVADTLSNLRGWLRNQMNAPGSPADRGDLLTLEALSADPYRTMGLAGHEAFHVFQHARAPDKEITEAALLEYPVLSVDNNLGVALEAQALAAALRAQDEGEILRAARAALAIRLWRRAGLPQSAIAYEDGIEFTEGLAKYVEYALTEALEGRTPIAEMRWVRGFVGFADMSVQRERLIKALLDVTDGTLVVNNDPYGAAPVRFRLYSSGMAIGALLDRLDTPGWKRRIMEPGVTLTGLLAERLGDFDRDAALKAAMASDDALLQRERVTRLAEAGRAANAALLASILEADPATPSWRLVIDYSALGDADPAFGYTPFGTTTLAPGRVIYRMVPVSGRIPGGGDFQQLHPAPMLHDSHDSTITFRVEGAVPDIAPRPAGTLDGVALPGVTLDLLRGSVSVEGDTVVIRLLPASPAE